MSEWRSIKTAPKDMTEVIVFALEADPQVFTACWICGWGRSSGGIEAVRDDFYGDGAIYPTHWMPLPKPPRD